MDSKNEGSKTSLGKLVSIADYRKLSLERELLSTLASLQKLISRFDVLGLEELRVHAVQAFNEISVVKTKVEEIVSGAVDDKNL